MSGRSQGDLTGSLRLIAGVLLLRDIEEMDTAATANILEMTEYNVKRRLHRALGGRFTPLLEPMMRDGDRGFRIIIDRATQCVTAIQSLRID